mmetsp:Transcript_7263/g.13551  ORF Transcript_7263/g.13551 Transcript_7263/m.13551 type:complete len:1047 (+) Transcript_7263:186-3326(+)|eukprot:CAMPEP_0197532096 /NCGR_PEP_ID=MMETSP1318-20131121/38464_1 /TAXON_ID=552666 /ORGANISM="Partenskyella glossopodia, Strain RCC365" /LENGTH=1046 /DNA_ID=CAMNT_0043088553 /DNA_START=80 /DNA_END=3220 /DNA_ORIENTATION=-
MDELSIEELLDFYVSRPNARSSKVMRGVQDNVNGLFSKDYTVKTINNEDGSYCSSYPLDLVILENHKNTAKTEPLNLTNDLREQFQRGKFARVRGRFPIPVILWNNKNICRSSTISVQAEVLLNMSTAKIRDIRNQLFVGQQKDKTKQPESGRGNTKNNEVSHTVEAQRKCDAEILSNLQVKYICDLMVEQHKTKFGVVCSSSEKAESSPYEEFHIQPMPYPGCEFFRDFKENKHCGQDLRFNWDCSYIDAKLVHPRASGAELDLDWGEYKSWDIVVLTQNYFRLLMEYITDTSNSSGVLVHCISGWDRTPLFISLLRLSLWADGEIHQSLDAKEILFLTLGYDWMLFSHLLDDRLSKGEDIFYFCFYMLPFLIKREFSTILRPRRVARPSVAMPETSGKVFNGSADSLSEDSRTSEDADSKTTNGSKEILADVQENHFFIGEGGSGSGSIEPAGAPAATSQAQEQAKASNDGGGAQQEQQEQHQVVCHSPKVIQGFSISESTNFEIKERGSASLNGETERVAASAGNGLDTSRSAGASQSKFNVFKGGWGDLAAESQRDARSETNAVEVADGSFCVDGGEVKSRDSIEEKGNNSNNNSDGSCEPNKARVGRIRTEASSSLNKPNEMAQRPRSNPIPMEPRDVEGGPGMAGPPRYVREGSISDNELEYSYSGKKSKPINIVALHRSVSAGGRGSDAHYNSHSRHSLDVKAGSWQLVGSDLGTNSPSELTPPRASSFRPSPPVLRKLMNDEFKENHAKNTDNSSSSNTNAQTCSIPIAMRPQPKSGMSSSAGSMENSFTAKMFPSYDKTVGMVAGPGERHQHSFTTKIFPPYDFGSDSHGHTNNVREKSELESEESQVKGRTGAGVAAEAAVAATAATTSKEEDSKKDNDVFKNENTRQPLETTATTTTEETEARQTDDITATPKETPLEVQEPRPQQHIPQQEQEVQVPHKEARKKTKEEAAKRHETQKINDAVASSNSSVKDKGPDEQGHREPSKEDAQKLIRREQRLRLVHDLFMHAYRERVITSTNSLSPRQGLLGWLPKSLY